MDKKLTSGGNVAELMGEKAREICLALESSGKTAPKDWAMAITQALRDARDEALEEAAMIFDQFDGVFIGHKNAAQEDIRALKGKSE